MKTIGLVSIGQSPREDLTRPLRSLRPDLRFKEAGALDQVAFEALPPSLGRYPLHTRLRDGRAVSIDLGTLEPYLQQAVDRVEEMGVVATLLLCAGTFASLRSAVPLIRPYLLVQSLLQATGMTRIGIIAPFAEQEADIRQRWLDAGFAAFTASAALTDRPRIDTLVSTWVETPQPVDAIVLDYVGHDPLDVAQLRARHHVPIFDLGLIAMIALAAIV